MKSRTRQTLEIFWNHAKVYPRAIFLLCVAMVGAVAFVIRNFGKFRRADLRKQIDRALGILARA